MAEYKLTKKAVEDLAKIYDYIHKAKSLDFVLIQI